MTLTLIARSLPRWTLVVVFLLCLFVLVDSVVPSTTTTRTHSIKFQPSRIVLDQVSQSYPKTLFRTLFSSVPERELALCNVSLVAESEMVVLLGASSSGKSTLMKLVSGAETPVSGQVRLAAGSTTTPCVPVFLDQKPPYDDSRTIETLLDKIVRKHLDCEKIGSGSSICDSICGMVGLVDVTRKPSQLSPSENYRYGLVRASLDSVLPALESIDDMVNSGVPSPILLLDEWMDVEPSGIVHKVEDAMLRLTDKCGAVILCATHKPHLFAKRHRAITLCRGEILSEGIL